MRIGSPGSTAPSTHRNLPALAAVAMCAAFTSAVSQAQEPATTADDLTRLIRASLHAERPLIQAGQPVWIDFRLSNLTANRLTLRVPEVSIEDGDVSEMGLPLEHVFSGRGFSALNVQDDYGERHDSQVSLKPKGEVPAIRLAPYGSVGLRVDLTRYYESLQRPGKYKLIWRPYNGNIASEPLTLTVLAERQAVITTDYGKMTIRFYYDAAPNHVQNFIELVEQRFYDNLTFNRIIPGGLIQGGDPLGNRRGVRPDGKRLKAEFNSVPFEYGTVGMARSPQDPDSGSCQFFICLSRQPSLDGQYTAFGYVHGDQSFETLRRIAAVPTYNKNGLEDFPRKPVYIRVISLENVPVRERQTGSSRLSDATGRGGLQSPSIIAGDAARPPAGDAGAPGDGVKSDLPGLKAISRTSPASQPATAP